MLEAFIGDANPAARRFYDGAQLNPTRKNLGTHRDFQTEISNPSKRHGNPLAGPKPESDFQSKCSVIVLQGEEFDRIWALPNPEKKRQTGPKIALEQRP